MRLGFGLGFNRRRGGATGTPIANQDVVIASASTINLDGPFADYSGDPQTLTYSVTAGTPPVGMAVSGYQLTGTPLAEKMRETLTVQATNGTSYTNTAQFDLGCTWKAGIAAPSFDNWRVDVPSIIAAGFDTDVTAANQSALWTAIETALMDGGTATTPKLHRITYTGPDAPTGYIRAAYYGGTPSDYSWVLVDGQGTTWGWLEMAYAHVIFHDFNLIGSDVPVRRPFHQSSGGVTQLNQCVLGHYNSDTPNRYDQTPVGNGPMEATLVDCWLAGGSNGIAIQSHNLTVQNCLFTHLAADFLTHFSATPQDYFQRVQGNVMCLTRQLLPAGHPDAWQTGGAVRTRGQWNENIVIQDQMTTGTSGYRFGNESANNGDLDIQFKSNVWSITGFAMGGAPAGTTGITGTIDIEDHVSIPAPGGGSQGDSWDIGDASLVVTNIKDYLTGHDPSGTINASGIATIYDRTNAASIEAVFPNMTGQLKAWTNHTTQGPTTTYVPDDIQAGHNPREWRQAISTMFQPAGGWGTHKNPATYGLDGSWPVPGAFTRPTLSAISVATTTLTVTTSVTGGKLWAFVASRGRKPSFACLRHGVNEDGTISATPETDVDVFNVTAAGSQNYTLSQDATGKAVHLVYEDADGYFSVVESTGSLHPSAFVDADITLATGTGSGVVDLTINWLPADNGSAITDVEYDIDGDESWTSVPSYAGVGSYSLILPAASTAYVLRFRAVNALGESDAGPNEAVTSGSPLPLPTYLGADTYTGGSGSRTYSFTGGVAGNRVAIVVCSATGAGLTNVTIGGVAAGAAKVSDTQDVRLHVFDAVLASSGAFDVVMDADGAYSDNWVIAYDVEDKVFTTSAEAYRNSTAPATLDLSANTQASDFAIVGIQGGTTTDVTAATGWTQMDGSGLVRNVKYIAGSHGAIGGSPERMLLDYNVQYTYANALMAVYR